VIVRDRFEHDGGARTDAALRTFTSPEGIFDAFVLGKPCALIFRWCLFWVHGRCGARLFWWEGSSAFARQPLRARHLERGMPSLGLVVLDLFLRTGAWMIPAIRGGLGLMRLPRG